jgi:RNA polymerase sigma-70 factor (ECF subfamily)
MTDEGDLLERIRAGDEAALELLYRTYAAGVRATLTRVVGRGWADDLVQEVFLRAVVGLPTFRGESSLKHWLMRIAVNCGLKHLRSERSRPVSSIEDRLPCPQPGPEETALAAADRRQARDALQAVPAADRRILYLREVLGLPYETIQQHLELASTGTVKSRLHHARESIRRAWSLRKVATGENHER